MGNKNLYQVNAIEIRSRDVLYTVEADDRAEALKKAAAGDICEEKELGEDEVLGRKITNVTFLTSQTDDDSQETAEQNPESDAQG